MVDLKTIWLLVLFVPVAINERRRFLYSAPKGGCYRHSTTTGGKRGTLKRRYSTNFGLFEEIAVEEGTNVTLACKDDIKKYPIWSSTDLNSNNILEINEEGGRNFNPQLGEKLSRLAWDPANNINLIIINVTKNDSAIYTCEYPVNLEFISVTHKVFVRVIPKTPVVSGTKTINGNMVVVRGTQNQRLEMTCTSDGGYPKPILQWFRGIDKSQKLTSVETFTTKNDGNFNVVLKYTFQPTREDDRVSYLCQSSFDPPNSSYQSDQVLLYLNLKPLTPSVTSYTVTEEVSKQVADCTTSQFRPNRTKVWLEMGGNNVSTVPDISYVKDATTETYSLTASFSFSLTRKSNGKNVVCHIAHETLLTSLTGSGTIDVHFRPSTAQLTGATSNIVANDTNTISLNCTSATSNPPSTIKWFINNQEETNGDSVQVSNGDNNGKVTSQILKFVPDHSMDGQEVYCTVNNSVDEQTAVQSEPKTLDLLYHPIITSLSAVNEVVEGSQTTFRCHVHSKPSANMTWYHGSDVVLTDRPTLKNIGEFVIPRVNRRQTGTYKCVAQNGYIPNGANETDLVVQYTPDVEVTTSNVTINDTTASLICTAVGVPTVYTYSEWQHMWPGYGSLKHTVTLGNNSILTLTSLTYENSGVYQCTASNGVSGSLNPNAGYGKAYLKIETYPIITTEYPKKVPAQLNISTSTTIHFYSNRDDNKVECYRRANKDNCSYVIQKGTINLPVFDHVIPTEGLAANITFVIQHMDHFGALTIIISNGIGETSIAISVVPEGTKKTSSDIMAIVAGVVVTGVLVLIACIVVLVLVVIYRRKKGGKKEQNRRSSYGDENIYDEDGMEINQANESGESLGIQPSSTTDGASNIYAQVDKSKKQTMQAEDNTYAVVDKTKRKDDTLLGQTDIYATPMKKKDTKQTKNNYQKKKGNKDKKDKGNKRTCDDVYENAQELDLYRNIEQTDETAEANLYHNRDENIPYKRILNKDGLLYADLAFDNNNKGQKELVIHGLENATDYVEVDFSKKAEPLPESDEEACNSQNNV